MAIRAVGGWCVRPAWPGRRAESTLLALVKHNTRFASEWRRTRFLQRSAYLGEGEAVRHTLPCTDSTTYAERGKGEDAQWVLPLPVRPEPGSSKGWPIRTAAGGSLRPAWCKRREEFSLWARVDGPNAEALDGYAGGARSEAHRGWGEERGNTLPVASMTIRRAWEGGKPIFGFPPSQ